MATVKNHHIALLFAVLLAGCAMPEPPPSALSFYDVCATQNPSFIPMVECGKANHANYCAGGNLCSADDNAVVTYMDSLVVSVRHHELTEAAAQRKWIEFRMNQENAQREQELQAEAIMQANRPVTCFNGFNGGLFGNCH